VPPLGETIAIVGDVKQAGIFELPADTGALSVDKALRYAGGGLRARANRYITLNLQENGKQVVNVAAKGTLHANDILLVQRTNQQQQGVVTLAGHVQNVGQRSLTTATTVRELLGDSKSLKPNAYLLFAALLRQQDNSTNTKIIPVNLQNILNGTEDVALQDQDQLVVLSRDDVQYLWSADVQALLQEKLPPSLDIALSRAVGDAALIQPNANTAPAEKSPNPSSPSAKVLPLFPPLPVEQTTPSATSGDIDTFAAQIAAENKPTTPSSFLARGYSNYNVVQAPICKGLQALQYIVKAQGSSRFLSAKHLSDSLNRTDTAPALENYGECPTIFYQYGDILPVLLDNVAVLTGEVNKPGVYPVANTVALEDLLQAAGGLSSKADKNAIRLTQLTLDPVSGEEKANPITVALSDATATTAVRVGDYVDVSQRVSERSIGIVELTGQFRRPGIYDVREKETLSSVIARAGGLSSEAYPYGAVFTRNSMREQEKENFKRLASQLETSLLTSLDKVGTNGNPQLILDATQRLIQSLKETIPLGRMVIEADPDVLAVTPQKDILLEAGDKLFMPKRPFFVMVSGDVLSAGARQFDPKNTAEDYIKLAGGLKSSAADDQIFLVLPNGDAKPLSLSAWNYTEENIPPGSAIVVPTEPVNASFFSSIRDASQVLGQVALTAASVAVIGRK
jgi:protein involved in polysaccharide export with SLBB domain